MYPLNVGTCVQAHVEHAIRGACTRSVQPSVRDSCCVVIFAQINVPKIVPLVQRNADLPVFMDHVVTNATNFVSHAPKCVCGSANILNVPKTVERSVTDQDVTSHARKRYAVAFIVVLDCVESSAL